MIAADTATGFALKRSLEELIEQEASGQPVRKTRPRSRRTRERILETAAHLFAKEGYKATSLDLVAEKLSIKRQALYYYFRSKQEILEALMGDVRQRLEEHVDGSAYDEGERFARMLEAHIEFIVENIEQMTILHRERAEISQIKGFDAAGWSRQYIERFAEAYREGVSAGRLKEANSQAVASLLINASNAVTSWYREQMRKSLRPRLLSRLVFETLLSGVER